jgi:hypothetical protein
VASLPRQSLVAVAQRDFLLPERVITKGATLPSQTNIMKFKMKNQKYLLNVLSSGSIM